MAKPLHMTTAVDAAIYQKETSQFVSTDTDTDTDADADADAGAGTGTGTGTSTGIRPKRKASSPIHSPAT
jgi:hypothetical protein